MSFGFSVSDILTATQLAYKIYGVVQTGRKDAPASFGEVSDALFGLRCALEHLSQQVPKMSSAIPTKETNKIYQDLGVMIGGCSNTLQRLEDYLAKYSASVAPAPPTNVPIRPGQIGQGKKLLRATRVEWKKIQWAKDERSLLDMRQKLLGHQNNINMVVQTIQWYGHIRYRYYFRTLSFNFRFCEIWIFFFDFQQPFLSAYPSWRMHFRLMERPSDIVF